ncbi:MAG: hypothetical protein RJB61_908 [Actinomycetota bacterium]|jgi:hypothetical protein
MARTRPTSTLARAVIPVAAGIAFFAVLGLALWGVAALIADNAVETEEILLPTYQDLGSVDTFAEIVAEGGPLVMADLIGSDRSIVLDHTGDDPRQGWAIYLAYPADRDPTCPVELTPGTRNFTDCDGRTVGIDQLALPPVGVQPIVSDDGLLTLDLVATTPTTAD